MKYFEYCPNCKTEGIKEDRLPKVNHVGTDGWGQPVRYTDCDCGSKLKGFLQTSFYESRGQEIDASFISYMKSRIEFYYEGFSKVYKAKDLQLGGGQDAQSNEA